VVPIGTKATSDIDHVFAEGRRGKRHPLEALFEAFPSEAQASSHSTQLPVDRISFELSSSSLSRLPSIRREDRASARDLAGDEPKRREPAIIAEEALATAQDDRIDHEPELVDKVVSHECVE
jgi:hypothetical protein